MKNYLLYFVIGLVSISCDDEGDVGNPLTGKWDWSGTCGGFSGLCDYPSPGNERSIFFTSTRFTGRIGAVDYIDVPYVIGTEEGAIDPRHFLMLENGVSYEIVIKRHRLEIIPGDFVEYYAPAGMPNLIRDRPGY